MEIELKIDSAYQETKVLILSNELTDEVKEVLNKLSEEAPRLLTGFQADTVKVLEQAQIIHCYAENGKVFAVTKDGAYTVRLRLYELEERLDKKNFVRISNSELINLKHVTRFDLKLSGTICVLLSNGRVTYASRRYVTKIKQLLGI